MKSSGNDVILRLKTTILVLKRSFMSSEDRSSHRYSEWAAPYNVNFDVEIGLLRLESTCI